jgi:hypothetical protein
MPASLLGLSGTAKQLAGKVEFSPAAPKGAIDNTAHAVCLKAYPDTNRGFFRKL